MTEPVGSLGEEAVRLLRALAEQKTADQGSSATEDPSSEGPHTCPTGWCPICQVVEFVRQNPEAIAGVAASASSMLSSVRDLIDIAMSPKDPS